MPSSLGYYQSMYLRMDVPLIFLALYGAVEYECFLQRWHVKKIFKDFGLMTMSWIIKSTVTTGGVKEELESELN